MKDGKISRLGLERVRFREGFGSELGEESKGGVSVFERLMVVGRVCWRLFECWLEFFGGQGGGEFESFINMVFV